MTASEYMQQVDAIPPDTPAWSALARMQERDIRHFLVVENGVLVGILSNRDFRKLVARLGAQATVDAVRSVTVAEIMTPAPLVTVHPDTHIVDVAKLIVAHGIGCVPVVEAAEGPIGILPQKAVMAALVELLT